MAGTTERRDVVELLLVRRAKLGGEQNLKAKTAVFDPEMFFVWVLRFRLEFIMECMLVFFQNTFKRVWFGVYLLEMIWFGVYLLEMICMLCFYPIHVLLLAGLSVLFVDMWFDRKPT